MRSDHATGTSHAAVDDRALRRLRQATVGGGAQAAAAAARGSFDRQASAADGVGVRVREMRVSELSFAATLHLENSPHGLFPRLGAGFLRLYYRCFADGPHAVALVAWNGEAPFGVLVGTVSNPRHYAWTVRRFGVRLALRGMLALFCRPRVTIWFARTRLRRYARAVARSLDAPAGPRPGAGERADDVAVLTHVGVLAGLRGQGAGTALVDAFVERARAGGAREAQLVTLAGEAGAGTFYETRGWTSLSEHTGHDGHRFSTFSRPVAEGLR